MSHRGFCNSGTHPVFVRFADAQASAAHALLILLLLSDLSVVSHQLLMLI